MYKNPKHLAMLIWVLALIAMSAIAICTYAAFPTWKGIPFLCIAFFILLVGTLLLISQVQPETLMAFFRRFWKEASEYEEK